MHKSPHPDLSMENDVTSKQDWGAVDVTQNIRICSPCDETEKAVYIDAQELKAP